MKLCNKIEVKYLLLLLAGALFMTGCSTTHEHMPIAERTVFSDQEFSEAWNQHKIDADCKIVINCSDNLSGYRDSLLTTNKFAYPLKTIFYDICSSMRDRALRPDNQGAGFVVEIDVQKAQLQIEKHFFSFSKFTSTFKIKVLVRMFDPQHHRLFTTNLESLKTEEFEFTDEEDYDLKVSNVVYEACKDITKQIFKKISDNNVVIKELKKFE